MTHERGQEVGPSLGKVVLHRDAHDLSELAADELGRLNERLEDVGADGGLVLVVQPGALLLSGLPPLGRDVLQVDRRRLTDAEVRLGGGGDLHEADDVPLGVVVLLQVRLSLLAGGHVGR